MHESYSMYANEPLIDTKRRDTDKFLKKATPLSEASGALLLDILIRQQNTLQNILDALQRIEIILLEQQNR